MNEERVCTCYLEPNFMVCEGLNYTWSVEDAECHPIADCFEKEHAELIAYALNLMAEPHLNACLVHP